ncbi:MAG: hypothetical protein ACO2PM_12620 [Pyrobaculum sp.]|jgi:hypothetical protein
MGRFQTEADVVVLMALASVAIAVWAALLPQYAFISWAAGAMYYHVAVRWLEPLCEWRRYYYAVFAAGGVASIAAHIYAFCVGAHPGAQPNRLNVSGSGRLRGWHRRAPAAAHIGCSLSAPADSTKGNRCVRNMGLWIEIREKALCRDVFCVARVVIEALMDKTGLNEPQIPEEHVERLGKMISDEDGYALSEDGYTFTAGQLKITVYDVEFDIIECGLEGCEGYVVASALLEGDVKKAAKRIAKDLGIDKYL